MLINWALILIAGAIAAALFGFGAAAVLATDIGQALALVFVLLLCLLGLREILGARLPTDPPLQLARIPANRPIQGDRT